MRLGYEFFARDARSVARELLGKKLVRMLNNHRIAGRIVETEAYCATGPEDLACHGNKNKGRPTARTEVMFGPAGHAYVYFNYGIHWLFNIVSGESGKPSAVLIRALEPAEGETTISEKRSGRDRVEWTNGPAKLTQALGIDQKIDGQNLCHPDSVIWCEDALLPEAQTIGSGPRVGLGDLDEPWKSIPWRYWLKNNPFVSSPRR